MLQIAILTKKKKKCKKKWFTIFKFEHFKRVAVLKKNKIDYKKDT